jgi:ribosomal subunit interface protein
LLFTITGKHMAISEAMRARAEERTSKLPRYYSGINRVEVIVDGKEAGKTSVEVIARGEHGNVFVATEVGTDAYQCVDLAVHKLEGQLRKKKTRERDDKHVSGREVVE